MTDPEGRPVSGVMSFYFRDEVLPYYAGDYRGCARPRGQRLQVLGADAQGVCARSAVVRLRPQQARHRVLRFQAQLGVRARAAALRVSACSSATTIPQNNPLNPKYRALVAVWRRLPLPVANALGPMLVRNLG